MKPFAICFFAAFVLTANSARALMMSETLESPNKEFRVEIWSGPILSQTSLVVYYKNEKILELLDLGFLLDTGEPIPTPFVSRDFVQQKLDAGKRLDRRSRSIGAETREVRENGVAFNERAVVHKGFMKIVLRAYDDGVGFCFEFCPEKRETFKIKHETTVFTFADAFAAVDDGIGKKTEAVRLNLMEEITLPLRLSASGDWLRFHETAQKDGATFPASGLVAVEGKPHELGVSVKDNRPGAEPVSYRFRYEKEYPPLDASAETPVRTPWRRLWKSPRKPIEPGDVRDPK